MLATLGLDLGNLGADDDNEGVMREDNFLEHLLVISIVKRWCTNHAAEVEGQGSLILWNSLLVFF